MKCTMFNTEEKKVAINYYNKYNTIVMVLIVPRGHKLISKPIKKLNNKLINKYKLNNYE